MSSANFFLIGSSSRLAQGLHSVMDGSSLYRLDRSDYLNWHIDTTIDTIRNYFSEFSEKGVIIICAGITNTNATESDLYNVNCYLPLNIAKAVEGLNYKIITFGTILEVVAPEINAYVRSKGLLASLLSEHFPEALHIRLHTLYGIDEPVPHMFLGQIFESLQSDCVLKMTDGKQLREYHHILDDCAAILHLINTDLSGTFNLSCGSPVQLLTLARFIFSNFHKEHLLHSNQLARSDQENTSTYFKKPVEIQHIKFRSPTLGTLIYLRSQLNAKKGENYEAIL